jgi:hypothetical protein
MDKISNEVKFEKKSLYQRLKINRPNADKKELRAEVHKIERRRCQSNFKAMNRTEIEMAFRNRTETPSVGHYSPKWDAFLPQDRVTKFVPV